jgi:hypothetical protein
MSDDIAGTSLNINSNNADVLQNPTANVAVNFCANADASGVTPAFSNIHNLNVELRGNWGQYRYGGKTTAKVSFIPLSVRGEYIAAGQRFGLVGQVIGYGMGDCFWESLSVQYAGGPIAGDEGCGLSSVCHLDQQSNLVKANIIGVPEQATIDTIFTEAVAASADPQEVKVDRANGVVVGQWIIAGQEAPTGYPNIEAVEVTAVGAKTITGIFRCNHAAGDTITPALVFEIDNRYQLGQDRVWVNMSAEPHTSGIVSSIAGGGFTGSDTNWSTDMVGGNALNVGAISLVNDEYTAWPFDGAKGPLRSWHQIVSVTDPTHLGIHSFSVAGDASYKGKGAGDGAYQIRPAARLLMMWGGLAICETSTHAWRVGDVVELAICPYPDVSGFNYNIAHWTPNRGNLRGFMAVSNTGARTFETGITLTGHMMQGGGADTVGWGTGIYLASCSIGLMVGDAKVEAIRLGSVYSGASSDNAGKIHWMGTDIMPNTPNGGLTFHPCWSSYSEVNFYSPGVIKEPKGKAEFKELSMAWDGYADIKIMPEPPAPGANTARLYVEHDGSKVRLMVKFPTGAAQQVAIETG